MALAPPPCPTRPELEPRVSFRSPPVLVPRTLLQVLLDEGRWSAHDTLCPLLKYAAETATSHFFAIRRVLSRGISLTMHTTLPNGILFPAASGAETARTIRRFLLSHEAAV